MQHILADCSAGLLVLVLLLELPRQKLPVQLGRSPEQAMLETASQGSSVDTIRRHTAGPWHTLREDAAAEARVQDGHGAHDAGLVGEVDVQVDAQVAARGNVILLVVLLLNFGEGAVAEERAVEQRRVCAGSAEPLLRNHGDGALDGVSHDIAGAGVLDIGACGRSPATVACDSNDMRSSPKHFSEICLPAVLASASQPPASPSISAALR
jgi:hypothetical protein